MEMPQDSSTACILPGIGYQKTLALILSLACFFLSNPQETHAQWKGFEPSASGMGDAFVSLANSPMGGLYNPAGLALAKEREVSATYLNRYQLKSTHLSGLGYVDPITIPNHYGSFGITLSNFGFDLYHKFTASLGYGVLLFNRISIGAAGIYSHTFIRGYGNVGGIHFDIGAIAIVIPEILIGFSAKQVGEFGRLHEASSPSFSIGITYFPLETFLASLDIETQSPFPVCIKSGLVYEPVDAFTISVGVATSPLVFTGGISFHISGLTFHYAFAYYTQLGPSHSAGISLLIPRAPQKSFSSGRIKTLKYHIHNLYQPVLPD